MKRIPEDEILSAASILSSNGVAVLRTDTIYGIVARAEDRSACERVYAAKGRDATKPCIVLISNIAQIWDEVSRQAFVDAHPHLDDEPTSVIVPAGANTPSWIPHANGTIAYRLPSKPALRELIHATGPLIAPSANPAGDEPAASIEQAEVYFGNDVDVYIDGGEVIGAKPSRIIQVDASGKVERLR